MGTRAFTIFLSAALITSSASAFDESGKTETGTAGSAAVGTTADATPNLSASPAMPLGALTKAEASHFSPKLAMAMQACEVAAAPQGSSLDDLLYLPASVEIPTPADGGAPTVAEFMIHRTLGGATSYFLLQLSCPSGHWTYVSGTYKAKIGDAPSDALALHPWVRKAVEDAQQ